MKEMNDSTRVDELELWRSFAQTLRAVQKLLDSRLRTMGIGYQEFKVIGELVTSGRTSMAKLAERIMFTQAGVTYLIDRLEEQGYVVRVRSSEDRRIIFIETTDRGKKVFEEGLKVIRETTRELFQNLTHEELASMYNSLMKIQENTERAAATRQ